MTDTKRDPTRTEDVEGALDPDAVEQELVEENGECPECHAKPQDFPDGHTSWCKVGQTFQAVRDLRERLEKAEGSRDRWKRRARQNDEYWSRRADRLEEAVREADERLFNAESGDANDEAQTIAELRQALADARGTLRRALDSREDEGVTKPGRTHWKRQRCGACGAGVGDECFNDCPAPNCNCPVHADEPEGDEVCDRCGHEIEDPVLHYCHPDTRSTDEPVSGEGEDGTFQTTRNLVPVTADTVRCEVPWDWLDWSDGVHLDHGFADGMGRHREGYFHVHPRHAPSDHDPHGRTVRVRCAVGPADYWEQEGDPDEGYEPPPSSFRGEPIHEVTPAKDAHGMPWWIIVTREDTAPTHADARSEYEDPETGRTVDEILDSAWRKLSSASRENPKDDDGLNDVRRKQMRHSIGELKRLQARLSDRHDEEENE